MNETERVRVGALVSVLVLLVPGFLLHVAPRFPGSLTGSIFGIAAATLMVALLAYSLVKRSDWVRARTIKYVSPRAILSFHVYTGVVGALLGIIHSGHKFSSPLGIGLVAAMLVVVFSGFVGHYYAVQIAPDRQAQQNMLAVLRTRYAAVAGALSGDPRAAMAPVPDVPLPRLLGAIADLEYAIAAREALEQTFSRWTVLHVGAAIVMYTLLALHIWNGIYFGLRWLA